MVKINMKLLAKAVDDTRIYLRSLATRRDGLRVKDVSERSGVSINTVKSIMAGGNVDLSKVAAVQSAMIRMGIVSRNAVLTMDAWSKARTFGTKKR
jgi:hypothetical protein